MSSSNESEMDPDGHRDFDPAFYSDGYILAREYVGPEMTTKTIYSGLKHLYSVFDNFMKLFLETASQGGVAAVCKKGCSWCCMQAVYAQSHEFEYLERWLKINLREVELNSIREASQRKLLDTAKTDKAARARHRSACPLLQNNACIAYAARPMACRLYTSFDLESCKYDYFHPGDKDRFPQLFDFPIQAGRKMNEGFTQWLKEQGKVIKEYPMEEGLLTAGGELIN